VRGQGTGTSASRISIRASLPWCSPEFPETKGTQDILRLTSTLRGLCSYGLPIGKSDERHGAEEGLFHVERFSSGRDLLCPVFSICLYERAPHPVGRRAPSCRASSRQRSSRLLSINDYPVPLQIRQCISSFAKSSFLQWKQRFRGISSGNPLSPAPNLDEVVPGIPALAILCISIRVLPRHGWERRRSLHRSMPDNATTLMEKNVLSHLRNRQ